MLAKTTTHRQHHWLTHVKAADVSHGTMADYATTHTISLKSLYQGVSGTCLSIFAVSTVISVKLGSGLDEETVRKLQFKLYSDENYRYA